VALKKFTLCFRYFYLFKKKEHFQVLKLKLHHMTMSIFQIIGREKKFNAKKKWGKMQVFCSESRLQKFHTLPRELFFENFGKELLFSSSFFFYFLRA